MIELTVKTLDSQNHAFSVPDATTVKQLKEKIAESINIPADSQRLIYCGRVLADDRNLGEYGVHGKVIHLVHRPPPQPSRPNGNQSGNRTSHSQQHGRSAPRIRPTSNAMYLGAMAFPAELMDAQGIQLPQPSQNLSQSRLTVARRMVRRASAVLNRLENPGTQELQDTGTPPEEVENGSGSNGENGSAGSNQPQPFASSVAHAAHAATAAAVAAAISAANAAGVPNITILQSGQPQGAPEAVNIQLDGDEAVRNEQDPHVSSSDTNMQEVGEGAESGDAAQAAAPPSAPDSSSANVGETQSRRFPRTSDMAALMDDLQRLNERLQPFMHQYHQLMREDPAFEAESPALQEAQRVFNSVSEVMHFLSHAYHAMSDIICEFGRQPPRNLRCRPVLIQHSAVLQAGIPIQAQINLTPNRNGANNGTQTVNAAESENAASAPEMELNNPATNETTTTPSESEPASAEPEITEPDTNQSQSQEAPLAQPQQQPQENAFSITPGNVEFFMEVGPSSITIDSLAATVTLPNQSSGGNQGTESNVTPFPWVGPPSQEFIQNLMQAVAGHMMNRSGGSNTATQSQGAAAAAAAGAAGAAAAAAAAAAGGAAAASTGGGGQNSQARGNTATHPTTSTQTRSTSRPHVHLAPATMQSFSSSYFDPFLPCSSHHVRMFRRRQRAGQSQTQPSSAASSATTTTTTTTTTTSTGSTTETQGCPTSAEPVQTSREETQASQTPSQPQPQSQSQASPQIPPPMVNFVNFIHDIVGNFQGRGGGMSLGGMEGFPFSFPPPPMPSGTPHGATSGGSTTAASGGAQQLPNLSPLFNIFGRGTSGPESFPRGVLLPGAGPSLADLLQSMASQAYSSYTEGECIFTDLMMTLARNLTFQDVILQHFGHGEPLNRIRPQLREFISQRVLQGEAPTEENIARGADRFIQELRPHLDIVLEARLREDVDLVSTLNQHSQARLTEVMTYILAEGTDLYFGRKISDWCQRYLAETCAILVNCCLDGKQGVQAIILRYVERMTSNMEPAMQRWTVNSTVSQLRNYITHLDVSLEDIQRYFVFRVPGIGEPGATASAGAPLRSEPTNTKQAKRETPEPMETDGNSPEPVEINHVRSNCISEALKETEHTTSNVAMDAEPLPDVLLGSEPWHNALPAEWVPIIARDVQRQRRQNPQPPFSDAYLAGMPPKRRKIVTSAKPQGNLTNIISENVRRAVSSADVDAVTGLETVIQVAGSDPEIQAAYRDQVRSVVRDTLASSSDYTPERFPNTAKYFKK